MEIFNFLPAKVILWHHIFFASMLIHHLQNYFIQKSASTINLEYKNGGT
jgi:hypothetical protein